MGGWLERDKSEGKVKNMGGREVRARSIRRKGEEYRREMLERDKPEGKVKNMRQIEMLNTANPV